MTAIEHMTVTELFPGSPEAREKGCKCPVIDNHFGKGWGGNGDEFGWVFSSICPVHWEDKREE